MLRRLTSPTWSRERLIKLGRFAAVGLFSAALYAVIMLIAAEGIDFPPWLGSAAAYLICIPVNYLLQRFFTFTSDGKISEEVPRFLTTHAANLIISTMIVYVTVDFMGLPVLTAALSVVLVIPLPQFLVLENWVFARRNGKKLL